MTPKELRALANDKSLDIGTAWNALAEAADRIEKLEREVERLTWVGWLCPRCGKSLAPWVRECGCEGDSGVMAMPVTPAPRPPEMPWVGDPLVQPSVTGYPPPPETVTVCGSKTEWERK